LSIHYISAQRLFRETRSGQLPDLYLRLPGQTPDIAALLTLDASTVLTVTITSRVKTWSKSTTRRPHGAVASLPHEPIQDTHPWLSQTHNFPQLPKHRVGSTSLPLSIYTNLGLASLLSLLCDRHVVSGDRVIREKLGCIWICISLTVTLLCVLKVSVCPHRTCHNYP
jgi:hypothetical protein